MAYIIKDGKLVKKLKGFEKTGAFKAQSSDYKGFANSQTGKWKIPVQDGMIFFSAHTEAQKMLQNVMSDPAPAPVYTNDSDLEKMPFANNDAGFFIAILPTQSHPTTPNLRGFMIDPRYVKESKEIWAHFENSKVALGDGLYMISSCATWDMAQKHYKDIHKIFEYAVIGFSTPKRLQTFCENPAHYLIKQAA